jgi:hypothetical protein
MAMVMVTAAKRTTRAAVAVASIGDCDSGGGNDEDNGGDSAGGGHKQQSTK